MLTNEDKAKLTQAQANNSAKTVQVEPQTTGNSEPSRISPEDLAAAMAERDRKRHASEQERLRSERIGNWNDLVQKIGERYRDCRIDTMESYDDRQKPIVEAVTNYGLSLPERVAAGESLILFGVPGTGKDHMLAALMKLAILSHGFSVEWRNGMDLYGDFRDAIDTDSRESAMIRKLTNPNILAISDPVPPFGELKEFQAAQLFRIIDGRYRQRKPTWLTMNVASGSELASKVSEAIVDRLRHGALTLHCEWPSYRKR